MARVLWSLVLVCLFGTAALADISSGTEDGSEEWGYIDSRPGAHLFWWLYKSPDAITGATFDSSKPIIMWLQGGPGGSGVGFGNFGELGPLTVDLTPRETTWLKAAHLLFVDNPVGTGFSYVDDNSLLTTTNAEATIDLINFLRQFFNTHPDLRTVPFYVFCESYGGKFTSELAVAINRVAAQQTLVFNFQGVAMGDSWISPIDYMEAWGPQLRTESLLDDDSQATVDDFAVQARKAISEDRWIDAATLWAEQEDAIVGLTDNVDFYNILNHNVEDLELRFRSRVEAHYGGKLSAEMNARGSRERRAARQLAARHLGKLNANSLDDVMNGPVRKKLGVIPDSIKWGMSSNAVFETLFADFMKPTIDMVDTLLSIGTNVTIFSGQLDLICCTDGTLNWMKALKWKGMTAFNKTPRTPLYCPGAPYSTQAFYKSYQNLAFFWIMNAGHMVPADNGCMALKMVEIVTGQTMPSLRASI